MPIYPFRPDRRPYSGRHSAGYRFRFHVRDISHRPLFLPLEMKDLPHIQQLLQDVSPLDVFKRSSIESAREAFNDLRKQFDFPYWAVLSSSTTSPQQTPPTPPTSTSTSITDFLPKSHQLPPPHQVAKPIDH